jgi:uncharacterized membrane protein YccF (DUF307 family)
MIFLINLLWFICGGFLAWGGWMLSGLLLALSVVGLPWAFAAFRIAGFAAWPFGRQLVDARALGEQIIPGTGIANLLWGIGHVIAGVGLCCTIIGIPFGLAHFKLAAVSFAPLGKRVVDA